MAKKSKSKNSFQSIMDTLKTNIMNVKSTQTADDIDASLARITGSVINKDSSNYADMMKSNFSDILSKKFNFKDVNKEFLQTYITSERFIRYTNAEETVDCIPYCARALKVLSDEIVAPDDIDKSIIQVLQESSETEDAKREEDQIRRINKILEIEDNLHSIVYETLKMGDQFVEICDCTSDDVPLSHIMLNESEQKTSPQLMEEVEVTWPSEMISENGQLVEGSQTMNLTPTVVLEKTKDESVVGISNARLIIHDPRYVIKLQSYRFKMCLGYLVLPRYTFGPSSAANLKATVHGMNDYRDMSGIDALYSQIMKTVKKHVNDTEFSVSQTEVKNMIGRCIKEFDDTTLKEFKVRFVPPAKMEHFANNNRRFFPYGESIFYKTTFAAKLLIALETATTIKRISDSTDTRAFYIETGIPRNARDVIDEVREARTKRKVSLDKLNSIGSIPSMITSYEDYYIPQVNGKRFIEFDTIPPAVSVRDVTEELKFYRDVLVASLEVPPSYIGLEENMNNKAALSFENILFARTIVSYQKGLSKHLQSLFNKIHQMVFATSINPEINIQFSPPKMLQVERESEHMRMIADLVETLSNLGIDKEYLLKKYLPFDWKKLDEFEIESKLDEKMSPPEVTDEFGGGSQF